MKKQKSITITHIAPKLLKVNNILSNSSMKEDIRDEVKQYFDINDNENITSKSVGCRQNSAGGNLQH